MKKKQPKPEASIGVISALGTKDRHEGLFNEITSFEKKLKRYAQDNKLKIDGSFWIWEIK